MVGLCNSLGAWSLRASLRVFGFGVGLDSDIQGSIPAPNPNVNMGGFTN